MIAWEVVNGELRVVDADNAEIRIRGEGLVVDGAGSDVGRPIDDSVAVNAHELRFPDAVVYAFSLEGERRYALEPDGDPFTLPEGEFVLDVDADIKTFVRLSGPATVERADERLEVVVSTPDRRRAILGFRSLADSPTGSITTPPTPDGLAAAITHLAAAHETVGPERSYPTLRDHPPLLEVDDDLDVPADVRADTPDTGVELLVPPEFESVFVSAPLAYYLGASVRTADCEPFTISLPSIGLEHTPPTSLERAVERLLRKVFFLDCLVRNAGPYGTMLAESTILDALELSPHDLYAATPAERLATYLEIPHAAIGHRLPDWHLATYVSPDPSTVDVLPFLLDRLSLIFSPQTSELEGRELIERSLEEFYRTGARNVASVDVLKPELREGLAHAWLADGVPIDVFTTTPDAYYNRLGYLEQPSDATSVCVVLNDPEMAAEYASVAAACRERAAELSIDLTIEESLGTASLARLFETEYDFVHYIGHCEATGLRCPDGHLSTSSIERSRVRTFFLNACGSFYEGRGLVEKGSVAGAVTLAPVLDDHALTVGSTFAKLLVHGFSVERALELARRRIMMGKDYTVVGDGTYSLTRSGHRPSTTAGVEPLEDGRFALTLECYSTWSTGAYYVPSVADNRHAYLCGTESTFVVDRSELVTYLERTELPVVYDGDLSWSTEVRDRLVVDQRPS